MPDNQHNIPPRLRAASVLTNSFNEQENSIEVVAATDAEVLQVSWEGLMKEVLSMTAGHVRMDRITNGAQALDNHQRYGSVRESVVGVITAARLEAGKLICKIQFSERADLKDFIVDVKKGIIRNVSIGYRVYKYEITEEIGQVPVYRAIDWEPFEVSFVPVPADYLAGVRSQQTTTDNSVEIISSTNTNTNKMKRTTEILKLIRAAGLGIEFAETLINDENIDIEKARAMIDAEKAKSTGAPAPVPAPAGNEGSRSTETKLERKRSADILNAVRGAGFDIEFAETLINDENITVDGARAAIIAKLSAGRTQANPTNAANPGIEVRADEADKFRNAAVTGMVLRSGQVKEDKFKPDELVAGRGFQGMSLLRFAAECLKRAGVDISTLSDKEIAKRAITSSTSDFPVVLENVLHKMLLNSYAIVPDTWRKFCMVGSVTDFRAHKRLRPGSMSRLEQVGENGELKTKKINDATSESITAKTFGNIINISRNMIINDDLGYFSRLTSDLGRAAARSIEIDVYALLALNSGVGPTMSDGKALFHADHANIVTTALPSVASFDTYKVAMASQKDHNNNDILDITPSILVLGIANGAAADAVNDSLYDPDASNKLQKKNTSYKTFKELVATARITGNKQYAFADPTVLPVLEVAFLNGVQTPYLEQEQSFEQLGLQWRVYTDYAVGAIDWKGAAYNAGS